MIQNNPNQISETFSAEWKLKELKRFVKTNLKQLIAEYDFSKDIDINYGKYTLLVILDDQDKEQQALEELNKLADSVKQNMMGELIIRYVIKYKIQEPLMNSLYERIEELSGMEKEIVPNVLLLHDAHEGEELYKVDGDITA